MKICYRGGLLLRRGSFQEEELWVEEGKVVAPGKAADKIVDVSNLFIAPGYIDLQVNGGFGVDFSTEPERLHEVAKQLPRYGVTSFLPTLISSPQERYRALIAALKVPVEGAQPLGIHLEGPFFNAKRKGAHELANLCQEVPVDLEAFYGSLEGVKMVTLAPELPHALQAISLLQSKGIVAALGHTEAGYETALKAFASGARMVTHLFNGMAPLRQRAPGLIGAVLGERKAYYSVIVDEIHLHPSIVQIAWRSHPEGLILVSDAMAALGLAAGDYQLGALKVKVDKTGAYLAGSNTLAGSILGMDEAVRRLYRCTGCSKAEAIEAATLRPARLLGIDKTKGHLDIGADADFILLDDNLQLKTHFTQHH